MYCQTCGKQIPDGAKFCSFCGAQQARPAAGAQGAVYSRPQPQQPQQPARPAAAPRHAAQPAVQERENVLMGTVGALLGSLAGVVVMVILDRLGFVAALSGIVMMLGAVWGYNRFGKAASVKGLIISGVIAIGMVYVGNMVCVAITISQVMPYNFFESLRSIQVQLENNPDFPDVYYGSLAQQYLFAGIGAILMIVQFVREKKRSK